MSLLPNVQMEQTLAVTNPRHDAAEVKDLAARPEDRAGLWSLIFIMSNLCLRELQGLLGESGLDKERKENFSPKFSHLSPLWQENEGSDFKTWPASLCLQLAGGCERN